MKGIRPVQKFKPTWCESLSDYITALAWSPAGEYLAAAAASGEVILLHSQTFEITVLQTEATNSVDCLGFAHDGQFLAVGGEGVKVWQLTNRTPTLLTTLASSSPWIEQLSWHPATHQLAFSVGKSVEIWDINQQQHLKTLDFATSSVLALAWSNHGQSLAIGGYQGIQVWDTQNWDPPPKLLESPSASIAIAWSPDHRFIAHGNLDHSLIVVEWQAPELPWLMGGFPGKVRQLAWSEVSTSVGVPLLATCSATAVVVWERDPDENVGWNGRLLGNHPGTVQAIAFQPGSLLLASAALEGWVALWYGGKQLMQVLDTGAEGFSCLAWHPRGHQLAAGGRDGELVIWSQSQTGKGFGRG